MTSRDLSALCCESHLGEVQSLYRTIRRRPLPDRRSIGTQVSRIQRQRRVCDGWSNPRWARVGIDRMRRCRGCAARRDRAGLARDVREARSVRETAREARERSEFLVAPDSTSEDRSSWTFGVGAAIDKAEAGVRSFATPLAISVETPAETDWWRFRLKGAGYVRLKSPGASTLSGLGDVALDVAHPLTADLTALVGVNLPTRGKVGTRNVAEYALLLYRQSIAGPWSYAVSGEVNRVGGSTEGASRYGQALHAELDCDVGNHRTLLVGVERSHRRGVGSGTDFFGEFDFPVHKNLMAFVSVVRGVSTNARHTGVEFDLEFKF